MTRKEELEERVEKLASRFERIGESQAKYEIVEALLQVEREVWSRIIQQIDYRHCTVTMEQDTLKEWCMEKYKELT